MKKHLFLILFLMIQVVATFGQRPAALDTISFMLGQDNRVYVDVFVNGRTERTFRFLVDTGASDIVLNSNVPEIMSLANFSETVTNRSANSVEQAVATESNQQLNISNTVVKELRFIALPYPVEAWDGVLGLSFLMNFEMVFDYEKRLLYLYPKGSPVAFGQQGGLPVTFRMGVPTVPATVYINNRKHELQVELDSGSDRVLDINTPYVVSHGLEGTLKPFAFSKIMGSTSGKGQLLNVFFDKIELDGIVLPKIPGAFSTVTEGVQASDEMDGVIGNNLLHRFNQIWDFTNMRVYFQVNNRLYSPFYDFLIKR